MRQWTLKAITSVSKKGVKQNASGTQRDNKEAYKKNSGGRSQEK